MKRIFLAAILLVLAPTILWAQTDNRSSHYSVWGPILINTQGYPDLSDTAYFALEVNDTTKAVRLSGNDTTGIPPLARTITWNASDTSFYYGDGVEWRKLTGSGSGQIFQSLSLSNDTLTISHGNNVYLNYYPLTENPSGYLTKDSLNNTILNQDDSTQSADYKISGNATVGKMIVGDVDETYTNPAVIIKRNVTENDTSAHGFVDMSQLKSGKNYAAFDDETTVTDSIDYPSGSHFAEFQANGHNKASSPPSTIYGFTASFSNNGGTIPSYYGNYIHNPTGSYTSIFGYFADALTAGSSNSYQFFGSGTTGKSYFGGSVSINNNPSSGYTPTANLTVQSFHTDTVIARFLGLGEQPL